jgi:hypothetical protein
MTPLTKPGLRPISSHGPVLGPQAFKIACDAYELAWAEISPRVSADPIEMQTQQVRLANAVLAVSDDNSRDPEALKDLALQVMALKAPRRNDL